MGEFKILSIKLVNFSLIIMVNTHIVLKHRHFLAVFFDPRQITPKIGARPPKKWRKPTVEISVLVLVRLR